MYGQTSGGHVGVCGEGRKTNVFNYSGHEWSCHEIRKAANRRSGGRLQLGPQSLTGRSAFVLRKMREVFLRHDQAKFLTSGVFSD
jgi:hypothetical protein